MPDGRSSGAPTAGTDGFSTKGKTSKTTRKAVKNSCAAASKNVQATRKRNLNPNKTANETEPRKLRKRADAAEAAVSTPELNAVFGSDAGSDKDETDVEAANSPGDINGKKDADCGVKKNDKDAAAPSFEESSTATRAQQPAGATVGGTSCSGMTVKRTPSSPRVTQPLVPESLTAAAAASRAPTGNVDLGRDTAATAAAFLPRAPPPGTPTAFTGRRADSARMDNNNTIAPDSSPPALFRLSGARPVCGTAYSASLGRSTAAKETSSSARATAPLTATARAGGTADGRTLGRETVTEKTAVSPWPSAPLTETARIVRHVTGTAIQHDTAAEAPASSVPDSLPLATEQRTDGHSGGDRVDNVKAANEQASALDGRLALRASTPVVSTAWPERHAGA